MKKLFDEIPHLENEFVTLRRVTETDTKIITASTMMENHASARVLEKNGFLRALSGVPEDWGHPKMIRADKWIRREQTGSVKENIREHIRESIREHIKERTKENIKNTAKGWC